MGPKRTFRKSLLRVKATEKLLPAFTAGPIQNHNQRYRVLIDSLPLTVFEIDRHTRVIFANRQAITDSGYTAEELMGMPAINFFIPEDRGRIKESIGRLFNGERVSGNEYTVLRKNGSTFPVVIYSNPTFHEGQLVAITGIFVDISDRKIAEKELRESETKHRTLLENLPQKIFQKDINSKFISCNKNFARELGIDPAEIRGKTEYDFYSKELADRFVAHDKKIFKFGKTEIIEWAHRQQDREQWHHAVKTPIKDENNNITGVLGIFWDITESKQARLKVEQQLQFQKTLLDTIPNPVFYKDTEGRYTGCNEAFMEFLGKTSEEIIGKTVYDMASDDIAKKYFETDRELFTTGNKQCYEWKIKRKNGEIRDVIFNKAIIKNINGTQQGLIGVISDITERKQAEEELKKTEELFRNLVENIAIGVALISPKMEILTLNRQMKQWFPDVDAAKKPLCYEVFNEPPGKGVCSYCPTQKTLTDGDVHEAITATPVGDEIKNYRIVSSPIRDTNGNIECAIEMVEDITEKRQVSEQIRSLTKALLTTQESERLKISRELHDSLAQDLAAAKIHCDITLDRSSSGQPIPEKSLKNISDILINCISAVRRLAYDLRPSDLIQFGIVETIEKHCRVFSETHMIPVDFQAGGFKKITISDTLSINIFRLVQEGLNNIMKHASASQVVIRLFATFPHIVLRIEDNGKGFDVRKRQASITEEKRLGLRSMQERVDLLGGSMKIDSKPGLGTKLFIKVSCGEQIGDFEKNHIDR